MIRQLAIIAIKATGIPLALMAAGWAGTTLPLIPAAIIGAGACGTAGYSLSKAIWKLVEAHNQ
jgi:hypothetical protein